MTVQTIELIGAAILGEKAACIADPTDPAIAALANDMIDTMLAAPGVGLAAPQIGYRLRLVVFHVPAHRADPGEMPVPITIMVNPEIEILDPTRVTDWEGCLSVPDKRGQVPRASHIRYRYQSLDGTVRTREARGFHARVVQHECDHLDGVLYLERLSSPDDMVTFVRVPNSDEAAA